MRATHPAELTFVSISPERTSLSAVSQSLRLSHWCGLSPEYIGRPQGLRNQHPTIPTFDLRHTQLLNDLHTSPGKRPPLLQFLPVRDHQLTSDSLPTHTYAKGKFLQPHELLYRIYHTESILVRSTLELAGFHPTDSHDWNVLWLASAPLDYLFKGLNEYQRINHFPRTQEITRKDRLCAAMRRCKEKHGTRPFKFYPETYILPQEMTAFLEAYEKHKWPWIAKPCASSQGRGIVLLEAEGAAVPEEACVVSRYIDDPLLVNGLKFDLRLYVLVSSLCPLRIYLYEEGLARFACELFSPVHISKSRFIHLTNYSINKKNSQFQPNLDSRSDNIGHKWSLSALFKELDSQGKNTPLLWAKIYDLIVKTVICMEEDGVTAMEKLGVHRGNCFDLLGFDVMVDKKMQPWLMEVNLSPSLAIDSPLDLLIKSTLISDLFNLIGIRTFNRHTPDISQIRARLKAQKRTSAASMSDFKEMLRDTLEEYSRRGHFLRLYPAVNSDSYDGYFTSNRRENKWIYGVLYKGMSPGEGVDVVTASIGEGEDLRKAYTRRRNMSTDTSFLPSLDKARNLPCTKVRLSDALLEYITRLSEELTHQTSLSTDWKQRFDDFTDKLKWTNVKTDQITSLRQGLSHRVAKMKRNRDLEGLYGAAKTAEEATATERSREKLSLLSAAKLEKILSAAGSKPSRKALAGMFDSMGRGLLVTLMQSGKEQTQTTEQDGGEEVLSY